jgi:UDP-N-acetylmuramate dehydrogenase
VNVQTNIQLSTITTMRLGGNASYVADVVNIEELQKLFQNSKKLHQTVYVMGDGSNLIAHDEGYKGVIVRIRIKGIDVVAENETTTTITVGAGEIWDDVVKFTVDRNLQGIEAMSGIPGTAGAAPIQNIGAYGQELTNTFVWCEAYDTQTDAFVTIKWEDCHFSYRDSIFRSQMPGRYVITKLTLQLNKKQPEPPFYDSLQKYLVEHKIAPTEVSVQNVREAVLEIRGDKLPNPKVTPNSGSFFKNAIVEKWLSEDLQKNYPDLPWYEVDQEHVKIPAGWLIEAAELKGQVLHGMKVHDLNAVVLINESAKSYADLAAAREEIINAVRDRFRITLEQEPLELNPI